MIDWLYSNALGAAVLAVIAGVLIWTFRPGPAVRHALWLVVLVKLVSPTGLWVSVPLPIERPAVEEAVTTCPPSPSPPSDDPAEAVAEVRRVAIVRTTVDDIDQLAWVETPAAVEAAPAQADEAVAPCPPEQVAAAVAAQRGDDGDYPDPARSRALESRRALGEERAHGQQRRHHDHVEHPGEHRTTPCGCVAAPPTGRRATRRME